MPTLSLIVQRSGIRTPIKQIGPNDDGTADTIAAMQALVDEALTDAHTRGRLNRIVEMMPSTRPHVIDFAQALYAWCRRFVAFERDPVGEELIRSPADVLDQIDRQDQARVDCDDLATLGAALSAARGARPVFITVGRGQRFQHVFWGLVTDTRAFTARIDPWNVLPMDPQEGNAPGHWPTDARRTRIWSITPS